MEARLELKLSQKLIMTPQLQQAIKLLQLSRLELVQSVSQELIENPVLEEVTSETGEDSAEGDDASVPETSQTAESVSEAPPEQERAEELKSDLELGPQWDEYLNEL